VGAEAGARPDPHGRAAHGLRAYRPLRVAEGRLGVGEQHRRPEDGLRAHLDRAQRDEHAVLADRGPGADPHLAAHRVDAHAVRERAACGELDPGAAGHRDPHAPPHADVAGDPQAPARPGAQPGEPQRRAGAQRPRQRP
jgi:hypothetical protein